MYKQAAQLKLRFDTTKGLLSVEQLYDLSLNRLAFIIKTLKKQLKKNNDDELSFLDEEATPVDKEVELRFNIAKDIYLTKKEEREATKTAADKKAHNEKILELIKEKQEEGLKNMSVEDLEKMIKE